MSTEGLIYGLLSRGVHECACTAKTGRMCGGSSGRSDDTEEIPKFDIMLSIQDAILHVLYH